MKSSRKRILWCGLVLAGIGYGSYQYLQKSEACQVQAQVEAKTIFSFLGAPGSGKGTLAEQTINKLGFKVVSTGNLCREEIAAGTEKGKMISEYTRSARLVPDKVIAEMVDAWLRKNAGDKPIILDGYPRTQEQAKVLLDLLKNKYSTYRFRVISLDIDDPEMIVQRVANRLVCENKKCQATYNRKLLKDPSNLVCERCGSKLIQRDDDREETVRRRLLDFKKNNDEIIAFYEKEGVKIEPIAITAKSSPAGTFEVFKGMVAH